MPQSAVQALALPPARPPAGAGAVRAEVRAFLARQDYVPRCDAWGSAWGWSPAFSRALAARGWIGMTWPERYGGAGRSALERFVVTEELLAAGAPVSAHWVADRQTGPALLRFGTEAQRERFLPAMARGECGFAIGMSEAGSGSDLASVATRAERVAGGWRVDGTKKWTGGAHVADFFVVLCRTGPHGDDRHAGLTQLIVDLRSPGISMRPIRLMHGVHQWNEVRLDGVLVPDDMLLGEAGAGWAQVVAELAHERSGPERILSTFPLLAAFAAATEPDDDPRVLSALGGLVARLAALRRLSLGVACALDEGRSPEVQAALVKDLGTTFERDVVEAVRSARPFLRRGAGASLDELLGQALLSTPGFTLRGGTTEILRSIVARQLVAADLPGVQEIAGHEIRPGATGALACARAITESADVVLDLALVHTRTREQFGRPLARFQAVQHHLAVLAGHVMLARAALDEGEEVAKICASAAAGEVARLGHQLHGAVGYSDEHPLHRFTRPLWAWRDELGTEAEWSARLGARMAGGDLWARLSPAGGS
ncbi:MAG TPA: acyl-CoA dehydrogenase family protein [Solirubrobacteraceae bacterium]